MRGKKIGYRETFFFRATSVAYGSAQARGQITAAAASVHHSHIGSLTH